jgi:hypothetical protein
MDSVSFRGSFIPFAADAQERAPSLPKEKPLPRSAFSDDEDYQFYMRQFAPSNPLPTFSDLSPEHRIYRTFVKNAPKWRYVREGLNLEAQCKTPACVAYRKFVWIQKGMGEFNILDFLYENTPCPMCANETEPAINVGYVDCIIKIEGQQIRPFRGPIEETLTCEGGGVTTYDGAHQAEWRLLKIKATPKV